MSVKEMAQRFFVNIQDSPQGRDILGKFNCRIEFELTDGESVSVNVRDGRVSTTAISDESNGSHTVHFITDHETLARLFGGKLRFTDAYTHQRGRSGGLAKGHLYVREAPGIGGTLGGVLVRWIGRLVRTGQELR